MILKTDVAVISGGVTGVAVAYYLSKAGIPISTGGIGRLTQTRLDAPPHVSVLCGCDNLAYESFAAGADGWVSMLSNLLSRKGKTVGCVRRPRLELTQEEKAYVLDHMNADSLQ